MSLQIHDIRKEIKNYIVVFIILLGMTAMTVFASNLKIGIAVGVTLALFIATVKGSLVARHFMHLKSEQNLVYMVLILAVILFAIMMLVIITFHFNNPEGLRYVS